MQFPWRTQWLNKSLVNQITYADGFVDGNPIFTDIFYITTENLNLNLTFSVQSNKVTQTFLFENSMKTASYLASENLNANLNLVYGASGAPYFGFLTPGSLIATVFNLETNQVLFNQQIANFTPTNSQISINESGVVVVFYTDASGNVYTYRTTVGSGNPLVDAVRNYSRLKPQKGRF